MMTKAEVIEWLIQIKDKYIYGGDEGFDAKRKEALDMAIEALQRTSNARPTHECVEPTHECVDLISRQAALDALNEYFARIGKLKRRGLTKGEKAISLDTVGTIKTLPSAQTEQHERIFQEIVVEYPSNSTYPEYEGKPYFSIKYVEDGRGYIGYGTYNPEVLSEYMKEYFIPSAQLIPKGKWLIEKTCNDNYDYRCSCCDWYECHAYPDVEPYNFCPNCGARMKGVDDEHDK